MSSRFISKETVRTDEIIILCHICKNPATIRYGNRYYCSSKCEDIDTIPCDVCKTHIAKYTCELCDSRFYCNSICKYNDKPTHLPLCNKKNV